MDLSSTNLRALLDAMPDPMLLVNEAGEIVFAGQQFESVLGYTYGELIGSPLETLLPLRRRAEHQLHRENFFRNPSSRRMGANLNLQARHKRGDEIPVEVSLSPIETTDGPMVLCAVRDITTQRRLLELLANEKAFTDGLIENAPTIILLLDTDGRIIKMNPFMERISGFKTEEVVGKEWFANFLPEKDQARIRHLFQDVLAADGHAGHVNAIVTRDGALRQIDWYARTLKDRDGKMIGLLNVGYDVTERLQQEKELEQARQLAERANQGKSKFLAAASHDLRQPLQSVGMYLSVLSRQIERPEQQAIVEKMQSSLKMMADLLDALLDISRLDSGTVVAEKRDFNIRNLLQRVVIDNLPTATEKGLTLDCKVPDCIVHSDPALLERVLENLVTNAIRYTNSGQVTIELTALNDALQIAVTDTGIGIPLEFQSKLFDEYFQLDNGSRDRKKGLGLGLSIVKRIAEVLDLSVEVASKPGYGSTFSVQVPLGKSGALGTGASPQAEPTVGDDFVRTVLLVDDDTAIVDAATMLLESANFKVHSAANGNDAVVLVDEGVCADVLISDFRLPGYNGIELIHRLRNMTGRKLPAILMTGDTSAEEIERAKLPDCTVFRKPVDVDRLITLVTTLAAVPPQPAVIAKSENRSA